MKFDISRSSPEKFRCDIISVGCFERPRDDDDDSVRPALIKHADGGIALDRALGGQLSKQIAAEKFTGARGTTRVLFTAGALPARFVLLAGLGPRDKFGLEVLREAGAALSRAARDVKASSAALVIEQGPLGEIGAPERARAMAEGVILGGYRFDKYKTDKGKNGTGLDTLTFLYGGGAKATKDEIEKGCIVASATCLCRDLSNTPASDATPMLIARQAQKVAKASGLSCRILSPAAIKKERMNGLLVVSKGSKEPCAFVIMKYRPKAKARADIALVGKGITFDSGGLSLKTAKSMETMKEDMSGAAVAIAVMQAIARLKPPVAVSAYIPLVENMPDGGAARPGDVYKTRSGKTIEVVSTDCEGRLILADAISYAADQKPDVMIDIATLTGGAVYCCGELYTLVLGTDQKVVDRLKRAADATGEPLWQLPIVDAYRKGYTSSIADMNNTGKSRAQTTMGAIFLKEFIGKIPWAHLDIAASSWTEEELPLSPRGGTGATVRMLVSFVCGFKKSVVD